MFSRAFYLLYYLWTIHVQYMQKGRNVFSSHFQQLRSYRDKIENPELGRNSFLFTNSSKGSFSCRRTMYRPPQYHTCIHSPHRDTLRIISLPPHRYYFAEFLISAVIKCSPLVKMCDARDAHGHIYDKQ